MAARYKVITKHGHPNASVAGAIQEHVFVMSEILGRPLMALEVVHHKDENKRNNHPDNLQLFATDALHLRHHAEERALAACGNRLFMKCRFCKTYDDPENMVLRKDAYGAHHKHCVNLAAVNRATPESKDKAATAAAARRATPEGKAAHKAALIKSRAKRKLSQQSI